MARYDGGCPQRSGEMAMQLGLGNAPQIVVGNRLAHRASQTTGCRSRMTTITGRSIVHGIQCHPVGWVEHCGVMCVHSFGQRFDAIDPTSR